MIKLGSKVTDSITGFSGTATSRVEYLTGCAQIGVTPKADKDGKMPESVYFDECRLDGTDLEKRFLGAGLASEPKTKKANLGGPSINIPARRP